LTTIVFGDLPEYIDQKLDMGEPKRFSQDASN
jgi:hypothetical protein